MKKIRYYLAVIALLATLSVPVLAGSLANAAASASFAAGHATHSVAVKRTPPCPVIGTDC
ncbi:MAG TPA: hypothetical protein VJO32_17325 [Ktedonobacteraceae bacterium]|nr:hypothetical protein [Ktedonobacteraceae bacterium]